MGEVVVDTHALLWTFETGGRLSRRAQRAIDEADLVHVPAICFWEVTMLRQKGRVTLDRPTRIWRRDVLADRRYEERPLDGATAVEGGELDEFHGDPADRLIVATAAAQRCPLVTKDRRIHDWARERSLEVIW